MPAVAVIEPGNPALGTPQADPRRTRRAVLATTGEVHNDASEHLTDAVDLMVRAVNGALGDLGPTQRQHILGRVGLVCATVGSDDSPDPAGAVAQRLGLTGATTMVAAVGIPQQRLVSNAILAVETGATDAVLVLGGEAKASALTARRSGVDAPEPPRGAGADHLLTPQGEFMADPEVAASMWDPVTQYALIDSALARKEGSSPKELLGDVSALWARFDRVAAANPNAVFAGPPHSATDLAYTTEENRLLAFPYNKWHSTQWALDHAAALLICSEDAANSAGLAQGSSYPLVAVDSSYALSLSRRGEPHRWPAMQTLGDVAAEHLGGDLSALDLCELYSCFPAAVRVQQRELGLPSTGTPTVTGGMAFAGGPFNHFTYLATAALAGRLRSGDGDRAMLTTVSGLLTKGGLMVWGREPHPRGALVADLADSVAKRTAAVDVEPFEERRGILVDDTVIAATVTGGFDPIMFALVDDERGRRRVVRTAVPDGDPAEVLAGYLH